MVKVQVIQWNHFSFKYFKYKENICTGSILAGPNDERHLLKRVDVMSHLN